MSTRDLFEEKFIRESDDQCWNWIAGKNKDGYGNFWANGKNIRSHRYSYLIYKGEIAPGLCVMYSCDNPSCVNPYHLSLGTNYDNIKDRDAKGRQKTYHRDKAHCIKGHEFTAENTRLDRYGYRHCNACNYAWSKNRTLKTGRRHSDSSLKD